MESVLRMHNILNASSLNFLLELERIMQENVAQEDV